jgi:hypothetical protein
MKTILSLAIIAAISIPPVASHIAILLKKLIKILLNGFVAP